MHTRTCQVCSKHFETRLSQGKHCSRVCGSKALAARRKLNRDPDWLEKRRAWNAVSNTKNKHKWGSEKTCEACGVAFRHANAGQRRACSRWCGMFLARGYWPHSDLPPAHSVKSSPIPEKHQARAATCIDCGAVFVIHWRGQSYCTRICAARAHARRREVRVRATPAAIRKTVSRAAILARDAYTCRLCNLPLAMDAVVPHPLAPTLDHIQPLALGGSHTEANLQAAHFICNATKGHRVAA